ncbi:MAG: DNA gyrase C-terminal beta-propeller domain-containing protein, partial [Rhodothermales bacterium]
VVPGSTRETVGFFTNFGKCYTIRVDSLPSTTGYGDPIQKLFDFFDKERVMGVVSFDARALPKPVPEPDAEPRLFIEGSEEAQKLLAFIVAISRTGQAVRFTIDGYTDPSTKNGRTFMKLDAGDQVVGVDVASGDENACLASQAGHVLIFPIHQIPIFKGSAKGVIAMRLAKGDRLLGFALSSAARDGLEVETSRGRREIVRTTKFEITNRGNKGKLIIRRGNLSRIVPTPVEIRLNGIH